jgi:hypothetical protein
MDIVGFLNDVTGGQLLLWKVIAATIVFALAGAQVFLAARFWRVSGFPPLKPTAAAAAHRWIGRIALVLAVLVAISCIAGPAGPVSPMRVLLHSIFGSALFVLLTVKFLLIRVLRSGDRVLPYVGTAVFLTFGAIWATSVADYVAAR